MTRSDINQWIDNDEGLYDWWRGTRLSKTAFIRQYRDELVAVIRNVTNGMQHASYLKYGAH